MVVELQSKAKFDEVLKLSHDHLVVIDFFATWCPPCKRIAPHFQQLSEELPDVKFFKLDVDVVSDVARSEGIRAMPTFKLYRNGRCEETIQGGNLPQVQAAIERLRPPPPLLEPVLDLAAVESESERREAAGILVRIASNILREPLNPKFRRLKVSNKIVTEKLLIVDGAMQCLIAMGFRDAEDAFVLDPEKALDEVRLVKSQIERIVLSEKPPSCDAAAKTEEAKVKPTTSTSMQPAQLPATQPSPGASASAPAPSLILNIGDKADQTSKFLDTISRTLEMLSVYEQPLLQEKARKAMDWEAFSSRVNTADTVALVQELLSWFKKDFFTWTDAPSCPSCDQKPVPVGNGVPTPAESNGWASRVELYLCSQHGEVRFPRYNHPGRLLETRTGRCGEWANAFMLILRTAGVRSRYVLDWTDHVWCEVFLKGRWVHCDPCEAALDKPLLYEAGWGKKLSYILSFGRYDVQDVTWRYTQHPKEVLTRRQKVSEAWLVKTLVTTRRRLQSIFPPDQRDAMALETLKELVELSTPPNALSDGEQLGRQSGSKEWRQQRGEMGKEFAGTIIRPLPEELEANCLEVRYNCPMDQYDRPKSSKQPSDMNGWQALVFSFENIGRKVESDWRMVYLARQEGSPAHDPGFLEWVVDLSQSDRCVSQLKVMMCGAEFESGKVKFTLHGDNGVACNVRGLFMDEGQQFKGTRKLTLRAELTGGDGCNAWQHAQVFRQKDSDSTLFPMNIMIELEKT